MAGVMTASDPKSGAVSGTISGPASAPTRISVASDDGKKVLQRLLLDTGKRYIGRYALAFFFMAVAAAATALTAYMMRDLINEVFINRSREWLVFLGSAVVVIYLAKGASMYFQMVIMARIGNSPLSPMCRTACSSGSWRKMSASFRVSPQRRSPLFLPTMPMPRDRCSTSLSPAPVAMCCR
jgi:hypothetical protein